MPDNIRPDMRILTDEGPAQTADDILEDEALARELQANDDGYDRKYYAYVIYLFFIKLYIIKFFFSMEQAIIQCNRFSTSSCA